MYTIPNLMVTDQLLKIYDHSTECYTIKKTHSLVIMMRKLYALLLKVYDRGFYNYQNNLPIRVRKISIKSQRSG